MSEIIDPRRLLNPPPITDDRYKSFQHLIQDQGIDTKLNMLYITSAGYIDSIEPERARGLVQMVASANQLLPFSRDIFYTCLKDGFFYDNFKVNAERDSIVKAFIEHDDPNWMIAKTTNAIDLIFSGIDYIAANYKTSPRETAISFTHATLEFYAHLGRRAKQEDSKSLAKTLYLYCLAGQAAILGVKTNGEAFARYPQAKLEMLEGIRFLVLAKDEEELRDNQVSALLNDLGVTAPEKADDSQKDLFILIG